ncbi:MAG: hypothetical protein O2919_04995 [Chloroflexi bacterium]|nr:hypothetical protein [Chloroflexota bacterium]
MLGAGRWVAWRTVAWPVLAPSARAVAALTFGAAFVSVAAVLVTATSDVATLESTALQLSREASPAAAAVLTLVNVTVLTVVAIASWPRPRLVRFAPVRPSGLSFVAGAAAMLATLALLTTAVAGLVDTLLGATPVAGRRLDVFNRLMASEATGGALEPLIRSLVVAGAAALLTILLAASAARLLRSGGTPPRDMAQAGLLLPVVLGPVAIAVALRDSLGLSAGLHLVIIAHALIVYPLALRIVATAPLEERDATEVARTLGASRFRAWAALRLPRSAPALVAAFLAVAVISFGEVAATVRLAGGAETAALVALRSATLPGGDVALAAAVVALGLSARWWQVATGGGPR